MDGRPNLDTSVGGFPKIVGFPPNHPILIGFSIITKSILGENPYFLETPISKVLESLEVFKKTHLQMEESQEKISIDWGHRW